MANVLKTLRNHWKKSIFFSCVAAYGVDYGRNKYRENQLMKMFCLEAKKYGESTVPVAFVPYHVTVVLNPAASGGKGRSKFESYCAPLLHLAGIKVSVIRTEGEGQAKDILEVVSDCDAILIAGGDGTLMEAVTGWMRRHKENKWERFKVPLGILPVGKSNYFARNLFSVETDVALMAEATMAVVRQLYFRPVDVIEVKNVSESDNFKGKKIYGVRDIQMGALKDAEARMGKYWIFAGLKKYVTYILSYTTGAKEVTWKVEGKLEKSDREDVDEPPVQTASRTLSWWELIFGAQSPQQKELTFTMADTGHEWEVIDDNFAGCELSFFSSNIQKLGREPGQKKLTAVLGPTDLTFFEYVRNGWIRQKGDFKDYFPGDWSVQTSSKFKFSPSGENDVDDKKIKKFYLDDEVIEILGPMEISLIPESILMFSSADSSYNFKRPEDKSQVQQPWWRNKNKIQSVSNHSSLKLI